MAFKTCRATLALLNSPAHPYGARTPDGVFPLDEEATFRVDDLNLHAGDAFQFSYGDDLYGRVAESEVAHG